MIEPISGMGGPLHGSNKLSCIDFGRIWKAIIDFINRLRGKKPDEPDKPGDKPPNGKPGGDIKPDDPSNGSDPVASVNITEIQKEKAMTVMVYEDAESIGTSRLESYKKQGLVTNDNINVIALTQQKGVAKAYLIDKEGAHPIVGNFGVKETVGIPSNAPKGTPDYAIRYKDNLEAFLTKSMHYFPANKYVVVMSGQGTGSSSDVGGAFTTFDGSFHKHGEAHGPQPGERMPVQAMLESMQKASITTGKKIDVAVLDMDNMGELDVAGKMHGVVDKVVFSQRETTHGELDGVDYKGARMRDEISLKKVSDRLAAGENLSNSEIANTIVSHSENPTTSSIDVDSTKVLLYG